MTRIHTQVTGAAQAERNLARHQAKINRAIRTEISKVAEAIRRDARSHLDDSGVRPVSRTGRLARSLDIVPSADGLNARITTRLDYGAFLEFGTRRMPAYPWLGPAVARHAAGFRQDIRKLLRALHGRSAK